MTSGEIGFDDANELKEGITEVVILVLRQLRRVRPHVLRSQVFQGIREPGANAGCRVSVQGVHQPIPSLV